MTKPAPPRKFPGLDKRKIISLTPALLGWFAAHARDLPWRRTRDPYAIWVSEIMLQQTQVKTVIPYWTRWLRELPDIAALAAAPADKIHKLWEGLGYYTRVRNLQKAAQVIVAEHGGVFPSRYEDILALPGIGPYTAGAVGSIAFNQPVPILDGNVIRVLTRLFGIAGNPKDKATNGQLWELAGQLVRAAGAKDGDRLAKFSGLNGLSATSPRPSPPFANGGEGGDAVGGRAAKGLAGAEKGLSLAPTSGLIGSSTTSPRPSPPFANGGEGGDAAGENCSHLNQSLMELGALICTPRNAQCLVCPVRKFCVACREQRVEELPNLGKRVAATARYFTAFVVRRQGKLLVRQRPAGVVNAHLWEFPNVETTGDEAETVHAARELLGVEPEQLAPLRTVKHAITRYRITLTAYTVTLKRAPAKVAGVWKTPAELTELAFTAAHKKLASAAAKSILSDR